MKAYTHEVDQKEVILDLNIWSVGHIFNFRFVSVLSLGVKYFSSLLVCVLFSPYSCLLINITVHCTVITVMWTSRLLWSHQSQLGSKNLKWAPAFSALWITPTLITYHLLLLLYVFTSLVQTLLNLPAQWDAQGHFRATHWPGTTGGRGHTFFYSQPSECSQTFSFLIQSLFSLILYCKMWSSVKWKFKTLNCFSDPTNQLDRHYQHFGQPGFWVRFHRRWTVIMLLLLLA